MNNHRIKVKNSRISLMIGASAIEHPWSIELKDKMLGHQSAWILNFLWQYIGQVGFYESWIKNYRAAWIIRLFGL